MYDARKGKLYALLLDFRILEQPNFQTYNVRLGIRGKLGYIYSKLFI